MSAYEISVFDMSQVPSAENDQFEFKGSRVSFDDLGTKLQCAASAFANTGGGWFIAGVDAKGNADGGIPLRKGRQDLLDWVDQIIHQHVVPAPKFHRRLVDDPMGRGFLTPDCAVLVVRFFESYLGPHQAPDKKYYIRAGAHTEAARHFIVEAIWAKRHMAKPKLTHLFRVKPGQDDIIQLGILSLTDSPALNVKIGLSPLPKRLKRLDAFFPLTISMIDRENPFYFDVGLWMAGEFGTDIQLSIDYTDLQGNEYSDKSILNAENAVPPKRIGEDSLRKIAGFLESIAESIKLSQKE